MQQMFQHHTCVFFFDANSSQYAYATCVVLKSFTDKTDKGSTFESVQPMRLEQSIVAISNRFFRTQEGL